MRVLGCLASVTMLIAAISAHADFSEADGMFGISARALGWVIRFPAQGYTLSAHRERQDGKGHYYMFTNDSNGLNVSFYIEPAEVCTSTVACREGYWKNRHPSIANAQAVRRFERNGFALLEFLIEYRVRELAERKAEQFHFSGHLVRDGYWVDMHLSKVPYTQSDRQIFLNFVNAIKIEPKGK